MFKKGINQLVSHPVSNGLRMSVRIVLHPDKKKGYIVICTSQNVSLGRFLSFQYVILANLFPSLTNAAPFSFILAMIYLTEKKKNDVSHFECNFRICDNEPKTRRINYV